MLLLLMLFTAAECLMAQDVIVTRESKRIDGKVLEVSDTEVRYKKQNNPDGPVFVIGTGKISSIMYANGEVQSFGEVPAAEEKAEAETEVAVPFEPLYREGSKIITSNSYPYEPGNLREMLGRDVYGNYLSAQSSYGRGATCVAFGWIDIGVSIPLYIIGYRGITERTMDDNTAALVLLTATLLDVSSAVLLPVGYAVRGSAAGRISRIAERYNAEHHRHLSMELGVSPTLLPLADGTVVPGAGLSLRF